MHKVFLPTAIYSHLKCQHPYVEVGSFRLFFLCLRSVCLCNAVDSLLRIGLRLYHASADLTTSTIGLPVLSLSLSLLTCSPSSFLPLLTLSVFFSLSLSLPLPLSLSLSLSIHLRSVELYSLFAVVFFHFRLSIGEVTCHFSKSVSEAQSENESWGWKRKEKELDDNKSLKRK